MNSLFMILTQYGFITGSRAFGTDNPDSDIDIVVCGFHKDQMCDALAAAKPA